MVTKRKPTVVKSAAEKASKQHFSIKTITPLTKNQELVFDEYAKEQHLVLSGSAGSGKSFLALYLSLNQILKSKSPYDKIIIIRSSVPTRDVGFVPGTLEEKSKIYQDPYIQIVNEILDRGDAWHYLLNEDILQFQTTSFLRGLTFRNCIIICDEIQSATFHEISTVLTRIGENCKFILCGDLAQNDLVSRKEKTGYNEIISVLSKIPSVSMIAFGHQDIVRSGFCRDFIIEKEKLGL
jgi:predicted ribonuclease YlaK